MSNEKMKKESEKKMSKEIADIFYEILEDFYDSIQYMDREDRVEDEQYSKYFKCRDWLDLDTARIGMYPNALPTARPLPLKKVRKK